MHQITTLKAVFQKIPIKTPFLAITVVYTGDWGRLNVKGQAVKGQRVMKGQRSYVLD